MKTRKTVSLVKDGIWWTVVAKRRLLRKMNANERLAAAYR